MSMRTFVFLILNFFQALLVFAQVQTSVPGPVLEVFQKEYPDAVNASWSVEKNAFKVFFVTGDQHRHINYYDSEGKVIRKENEIQSVDIPTSVRLYFQDNFPDVRNYSVWAVEDREGNIKYYSSYDNQVIFFDKTGIISKDIPDTINAH
jgi:hypothetical protein